MASVRSIEKAVRKLAPADSTAFRRWFAEFGAGIWDRQFEQDVSAGRFDALAEEAMRDLNQWRCTDL